MGPHSCATVQIFTEKSEGNPDGIVVINAADFDPETMELVPEQAAQNTPLEEVPVPVIGGETTAPPAPPAEITGEAPKVVAPWAAK